MRTSLEHLPDSKRQDLARAVEILFAEFERSVGGGELRKTGRILKVILFGSHGRGDWVDDPISGYVSDYDLLVVVDDERFADVLEYWAAADARLVEAYQVAHTLGAPVNFIVHSLADLNRRLKRGQYFFRDIAEDGVALFEAPGHPLERPKKLKPEEALREAEGYFEDWFGTAVEFMAGADFHLERGALKLAAFNLHQVTERLYHCLLLVRTLYSPKSHKLNFLRSQGEQLEPTLQAAWPRAARFEQRCFELLRRAYVDARYSREYRVTAEELDWLRAHVLALKDLVEDACRKQLNDLRREAEAK